MKKFSSAFKSKNSAKVIIPVMCVIIAVSASVVLGFQKDNASASADYTLLHKADLTDSISMKGIVESDNTQKVYSNLSYKVKEVFVEAGDYVKEGDILAQLETEDLERSLEKRKEEVSASHQSNINQLNNSQRILSEALSNLNNGTNSQIVSAETSLKTAEINLENTKKAYNDAVNDSNQGINTKLASAQSNLETAELDFNKRQKDYDNTKALFNAGGISLEELEQSEKTLKNAQIQYDDALLSLENAKTADSRTLEQAEENLKTAQTNYDNAVKALNSAKAKAQQDISDYKSKVESAQIAVNNKSNQLSIEELEKQLNDSAIYSPISGTVTAVYATEGSSGQGLLFIVEDTENLKITTYIKEYDVSKIKEGMKVVIRSDATGNDEYEGILSKIEPAAVKNTNGDTSSTTEVEFKAEIAVVSSETNLRIGMNTRTNIIISSKESVYSVPFESIKLGNNGQSTVFIIDDSGILHEIAVKTGLETDFYTEIESDALYDNARIASNITGLVDGMKTSLK